MIHIEIGRDGTGAIQQIELSGHAGFAEYGSDIVCAAVSSQVISVENSLTELLNVVTDVIVDDMEGGYLKLTLPAIDSADTQHDVQLLMRHLEFALQITAQTYPEFIEITQINL
ncbi:ribosomal-processing cysteine protease Prp [Aerococcaceae bacterium NML190938]|nr:ribosomal-processing cysteine protease Prp [Aerococcaceae bacterium NML190938]